jgi:signal transduction histidine kinase
MASTSRRRELISVLVLLATLFLTVAAATYAYHMGTAEERLRFERASDAVVAAITSRIDAYTAMLLGGAGLFAASSDVTRHEFHRYVERLELVPRYPGVQGIGYARLIRAGEREGVLAANRADIPAFRFWPERPPGDITAIVYLEPPDERNQLAMGFDMMSDAVRAEAMNRACDEAQPAATGRVRLVQEDADPGRAQSGFLIYVPVYRGGTVPASVEQRRRALLGFVYSPFRAEDLLDGVVSEAVRHTIGFEAYEGSVEDNRLLHRTELTTPPIAMQTKRVIDVAGRPWTVVLHRGSVLEVSGRRVIASLIAIGGGVLSILLFLVMRGQVRAMGAAEERAEELRRSEERLRAADRAKEEFLATVSHELRTPLNAIVGWTSMLERGMVPPHMQSHAIDVIARNAAAQTRLVEDLLDMSRAIAGHLRLKPVQLDIQGILDAAIDAVRPAADESGLTLEHRRGGPHGLIRADPVRLQQIVTNLLSNAIKFTPRGGRITLRAERSGDTVIIEVHDTGIGMAREFLPFVFDRFRQADSTATRSRGGAGLGLAIARHLVELQGGTIAATSDGPGKGSTFTVRLRVEGPQRGAFV